MATEFDAAVEDEPTLTPQQMTAIGYRIDMFMQQVDYQIILIQKQLQSTDHYINRAATASYALQNSFILQCKAITAEKQLIPLYEQAFLQTKLNHFDLVFGECTILGKRPTNEDSHALFGIRLRNSRFTVAAVFDGHAGDEAAAFCGSNYQRILYANEMFPYSLEATLRTSFKYMDREFVLKQRPSGCTAVSLIFDYYTNILYTANAGDARCICGTVVYVHECTHDHKPDKASERARIEACGSFVSTMSGIPRVNGILAVSRSIGDEEYKQYGVISEPDCYQYPADDLLYCIVACDGLFDVLNNQQIDVIVRSCLKMSEPTEGYRFYGQVGEVERENFEKTAKMLKDVGSMYFQGDVEQADLIIMDKMGTSGLNTALCKQPTLAMGTEERMAVLLTRIAFLMGSYDNITCLFGLAQKK